MTKYKALIMNMGLLTLGSFATKLLNFLLIPLYTSVLSTTEYGTYDLFYTTISLLVPILTLDIQEAVLRFALDKKTDKNMVFSVGIHYFFISTIIMIIFLVINCLFSIINLLKSFTLLFFLMFEITSLNGILTYFIRGLDDIKELTISSIISSILTVIFNFYFLLVMKLGLTGYFYAMIIGPSFQSIYLLIILVVRKKIKFHLQNKVFLINSMTKYSIPMIINAISWWINNASDRYIVTWICGFAANGLYSVSYKIPSIISILQSIFGQAWTISAVKEFDREDKSGFFINVYNFYNFSLVISCSMLIAIDKIIAKILFADKFYIAWKYAPFLLIGTVFSGMAAFIGGLFSAIKNSKKFAKTSIYASIINTIGNFILVSLIGPLGAAISTAISYMIMWQLRLINIRRDIDLNVNLHRDLLAYLILIIQSVFLLLSKNKAIIQWYQFLFVIFLLFLFKKEIIKIIKKFV